MRKTYYNQKGFSYHFLLPVLVVAIVGVIGLLMLRVGEAAVVQCNTGTILHTGSKNACVKYAEQILNSTSDTGVSVKADNKFDAGTKIKLERFQTTKSIAVSGTVDSSTWGQLCAVAKNNLPDVYNQAGCKIAVVGYSPAFMITGCGTLQAGTTDGTYLYFVCVGEGGRTMKIMKYTPAGEKLAESGVFTRKQLGHANDMTYNTKLHMLVVTAWDNDKKGNNGIKSAVRFIDPSSLTITSTNSLSDKQSASNICYNPETDQYVSNGRVYDSNLKYLKKIYDVDVIDKALGINKEKTILRQGIGCDSLYIYVLRVVFKQTGYNMIAIYDWSGKSIGAYRVNSNDEGESLSIINGVMYMGVNEGGMSKGDDYRNDYFIKLDPISPQKL